MWDDYGICNFHEVKLCSVYDFVKKDDAGFLDMVQLWGMKHDWRLLKVY